MSRRSWDGIGCAFFKTSGAEALGLEKPTRLVADEAASRFQSFRLPPFAKEEALCTDWHRHGW